MLEKCQQDNVIQFPSRQEKKGGAVFLSAKENGYLMIDTEGLSPHEIRDILCFAIHSSFEFEENANA
jgi:hypothetical protein